MNRLSAQTQMYLAIGLIAVLTIAFIVLAIVPKFQQASAVDAEIATAQTDLQAAQALLARRQSVKAQAAANEVELMRIANQVPDSPQLPSVIIELQDVANAAGVELPTISVGEISAAPAAEDGSSPGYDLVELTIGCTGQWANIIDFCRRINNLERGTRATTMTFTYVPETEEADAYIDVSGTIQVYTMAATSTVTPDGQ